MSIRDQIIAAIVAALINVTSAADRVFRSREEALGRDSSPAIIVKPDVEDDSVFSGTVDRHELTVDVGILVRGAPWDALADPLATSVHRLLMNDRALGNLCASMRKTTSKWDAEEADLTAGTLTMKYRFVYLSQASDISVSP